MDFIRSLKDTPGFDPNTRCVCARCAHVWALPCAATQSVAHSTERRRSDRTVFTAGSEGGGEGVCVHITTPRATGVNVVIVKV